MPFEARFSHGDPLMVDYLNEDTLAVDAGDVLVIGNNVRICHRSIPAGELGALGADGGVYDIAKDTGTDTAITAGTLVYWDDSAKQATATAGSNKKIGVAVEDASDDDTTVRVQHIAQAV